MISYVSTRGEAPSLGFEEAMLTGLARDGGLYVPAAVPVWRPEDFAALSGLRYEEVAFRVMRPFIDEGFSDSELQECIDAAYAGFGHEAVRRRANRPGAFSA